MFPLCLSQSLELTLQIAPPLPRRLRPLTTEQWFSMLFPISSLLLFLNLFLFCTNPPSTFTRFNTWNARILAYINIYNNS